MAATEIKVQMQQRRDTAAGWTSANPTLLSGEFGYETDSGKFKVGDGSTAWNSLGYIAGFSISSYPLATADIADDAITGDKLANDITIANDLTVTNNLTVNGTTTTINSTTLQVDDKNIELGTVASPSDATADGGGITLKGTTDKTIKWYNSTGAWTFSTHVDLSSAKEFRIAGTSVLSASTLGSGVTGSSLTSVGTITTGTWNGTAIDAAYLDSTVVTTGDTGTVTSTMISDGTIVNADINASAAIAGAKIDADFGAQDLTVDTNVLHVDATNDRVGIGTSSPSETLSVIGSDSGLYLASTGSEAVGYHFRRESSDGYLYVTGNQQAYSGYYFQLYPNGGSANTTVMSIKNNGNVGIGTSSPTKKLQVAGPLSSTDSITESHTSTGFQYKESAAEHVAYNKKTSSTYGYYWRTNDDGSASGANSKTIAEWYNDRLLFFTNNAERVRVDSSGNMLIRRTTNTDTAALCVDQDASGNNVGISTITTSTGSRFHLLFRNGNGQVGSIATSGTSTAFNTSSDYRLKENVVDLDGAIDRVKQLTPKRFNFIADADRTVDGFLAHEAQDVVPECVTGRKDETEDIGALTEWDGTIIETDIPQPKELTWEETTTDEDGNKITQTRTRTWEKTGERPVYQGIDQAKLVPLLTAALQEAIAKIESLETKVAALEYQGGA